MPTSTNTRKSKTPSPAQRAAAGMALMLCAAAAQAQAPQVIVRAKGQLAGNVGPLMEVRANGRVIGQVEVRSASYANFFFMVPSDIAFANSVDVVFKNDAVVNGQDRNLLVESVSANGKTLAPTASGVTYDVGDGAAAFDGKDVRPFQGGMWWGGALRFKFANDAGSGGDLLSQVHTKGKMANLKPSGPIVVSGSGRVIEGLKISNPTGPCIDIRENSGNITIRNNEIGPCGDDGIRIRQANGVEVVHNYIHDTTSVVMKYDDRTNTTYAATQIDGNAIQAEDSKNITARFNYIHNVTSGVYLSGAASSNLVFDKNYVVDVHSDRTRQSIPRIGGQMVQVNGMSSGAGTRVTCNVSEQRSANASVEDHVNFYQSKGTAQAPILIAFNRFLGGSTSMSGAGSQAGDDFGSHITTYKNNFVDAGTVGASISGGSNITIDANKIFHSPDYRAKHPWVWPAAIKVTKNNPAITAPCQNHRVTNNRVDTVKAGWGGKNLDIQASCPGVYQAGNVEGASPDLTEAKLASERFPECQ